jgi:hypothetical protein
MSYFIATRGPLLTNPQGVKGAPLQGAIWKSFKPCVGRTTNHRDSVSHPLDRGVSAHGRRLSFFLPDEKNEKIRNTFFNIGSLAQCMTDRQIDWFAFVFALMGP